MPNKKYDLAVVGGGLSGICAAISASRLGLKTALIQDRPVLGGNSSSEIKVHVGGADKHFRWARETGIVEEIRIEDRFRNHAPAKNGEKNAIWDLVLLEWVERESNLDLYLNASAREAHVNGGRIESITCHQLGNEKTHHIQASQYIDASGDGQIAYSAGASFRRGREAASEFGESMAPEEGDDKTMGSSLMFKAIDTGRPVSFYRPEWSEEYPTDEDLQFRRHEGIDTGYWWIELGGESNTITDNEEIRKELLACLLGVWDHIKNKGDHGAQTLALDWVGSIPGKRESRRFMGDHILTQGEVENMRDFPDAVSYGGWPIDLHPPGGIRQPGRPANMKKLPGPYGIPFRCLYSRDIENLMMAGRNISVTHVALGTTRLIATGAVEGQAVGTAAYLCHKYRTNPRQIYKKHIQELRQILLKNDCYIPGARNQDPRDVSRTGTARASSEMPVEQTVPDDFQKLDQPLGQIIPLSCKKLESVEVYLKSSAHTKITMRVRKANDWYLNQNQEDLVVTSQEVPVGTSWVSFSTPCKIEDEYCWVVLDPSPGVQWGYSKQNMVTVQRTEPGDFRKLKGTYLFRLHPRSRPYGPQNVLNGITRPEGGPNLWISDPNQDLPQYIKIEFENQERIHQIRITMDTNTDELVGRGPAPECIRAYSIHYLSDNQWRQIVRVKDNHHRVAVHQFEEVTTKAIKFATQETWGSKSARVYEIRAY